MKRILIFLLMAGPLYACQPAEVSEELSIDLEMKGDMLFEGSNTLQMAAKTSPEALAAQLEVGADKLKKVSVSKAVLRMNSTDATIAESLLLQIVSDNQALKTIGTLSPLGNADALELNLAEKLDLMPYLKDSGATWVLDLNITEDRMDEMTVEGILNLRVEYSN